MFKVRGRNLQNPTILLHSMIGYWHSNFVCLSVCPSVTPCIVALIVGVETRGLKVVPSSSYQATSYSLL